MLSLRTSDGLDLHQVGERFGERYAAVLRAALRRKLGSGLVRQHSHGDVWSLADPEGWLVSNSIISGLFAQVQDSCAEAERQQRCHA